MAPALTEHQAVRQNSFPHDSWSSSLSGGHRCGNGFGQTVLVFIGDWKQIHNDRKSSVMCACFSLGDRHGHVSSGQRACSSAQGFSVEADRQINSSTKPAPFTAVVKGFHPSQCEGLLLQW